MADREYTDDQGRVFRTNPNGRGGLREWRSDGSWGDLVKDYPEAEPRSIMATVAASQVRSTSVSRSGDDAVSTLLEFCGWAGVGVALLAALVVYAASADDSLGQGSADGVMAAAIAVVGTVQGLVLVGIARMVRYTKATAGLLAEALADR